MIVIGLTGSVASGKSTVAGWMSEKGIAVHDADKAVHNLLAAGGKAVPGIKARFGPGMVAPDGSIDRKKLGNHVFTIPTGRKVLESILHPLVRENRDQFLQDQLALATRIVVLDVPLLFETGGESACDYVIVANASNETIWQRAMSRPDMTKEKLNGILATQMPTCEKCQRADFVLDTDLDPDLTRQHLFAWLDALPAARTSSGS